MWLMELMHTPRPEQAKAELRLELAEFSYDGLVALREDLNAERVLTGNWSGCVLSYRRGDRGSVDCDREGRRGNTFTRLYDAGRLSNDDVLAEVEREIDRRRPRRMRPPEIEPAAPAGV